MIKNFVKISLKNSSKGKINETIQTRKSVVLSYPCNNTNDCTPYVLDVSKGVYKFEGWGSKGAEWGTSKPGLGGYTSGTLFVSKPTQFFVYIGNIGYFNAVKEMSETHGILPGGATDVRLNYSDNWWDNSSLISRIMVSAGGGGAEWSASIGGNGGGLTGGESISAKTNVGPGVHEDHCPGATQTKGSECISLPVNDSYSMSAFPGTFGSGGKTVPFKLENNGQDYGGFGGGGYYGGTSYQFSFAGSGGSSFISGYKGCDAVKEQPEAIEHTGQPNHYSGFIFTNTKMISGNKTMPLPDDPIKTGIYSGEGSFRITLIMYQYQCTYKKSLFSSLIPNMFIFICLPLNDSQHLY